MGVCGDICGDNRFEIIAKAKKNLLESSNIHTSEDEMKALDSFLFRCWQMGWLERYDKPREPLDIPTMTTDFVKEYGLPCPKGYIFKDENGNVINATKIVLEKKKNVYPKTYEECCKVLGIPIHGGIALVGNWCMEDGYIAQHLETLRTLSKLLICRDAYWKLYGEEMGLGKPWEPDWKNLECDKFCIWVDVGDITLRDVFRCQHVLAFPTKEMRDAFYENFKEEIEQCKELL